MKEQCWDQCLRKLTIRGRKTLIMIVTAGLDHYSVLTTWASDWLRRATLGSDWSRALTYFQPGTRNTTVFCESVRPLSINDEDPSFKQFLMEFKSIEIQNVWPTGKNGFWITRHQMDIRQPRS